MTRAVKTWIAVAAAACLGGCANGGSGLTSPSPLALATPSVPSSCAVPGAPDKLSADVTGTSVSLSWSAVGDASDYVVLVGWAPLNVRHLARRARSTERERYDTANLHFHPAIQVALIFRGSEKSAVSPHFFFAHRVRA